MTISRLHHLRMMVRNGSKSLAGAAEGRPEEDGYSQHNAEELCDAHEVPICAHWPEPSTASAVS